MKLIKGEVQYLAFFNVSFSFNFNRLAISYIKNSGNSRKISIDKVGGFDMIGVIARKEVLLFLK